MKVPTLSATSDTEIYIYYGNASCADQWNINGTWEPDYKMVQHLQETSGTHYDSSQYGNDGTPQGGVAQDAAGKINGADDFDGVDDYINCGSDASLDITDEITIEAWVKGEGSDFSPSQRTTGGLSDKYNPQQQVVGTKIYYVWHELEGSYNQIWTAEMNTDGTGWTAKKRTTTAYSKDDPQQQVVGTKIYYIWREYVGSYYQISTAEMNTDGTGWTATQRTTSAYHKFEPQLQVMGTKIYYVWNESDGTYYQISTAEMNTDGTDWTPTQRTTTAYSKEDPQQQVVGTKIYYVWSEYDGSYSQIWTGQLGSNILNKGDFYGIGIMGNTLKGFIDAGLDGLKYKGDAISYTAGAVVEYIIDNNWNHVAMTYDGSELKLYINGELKDSTTFSQPINTNDFELIIGDDFDGTIDEVHLLDEAKSGDWKKTCADNQVAPGSFHSVGFEETVLAVGVGGKAYPVNKLAILAPMIVLAVLLIGGVGCFMLRQRKA